MKYIKANQVYNYTTRFITSDGVVIIPDSASITIRNNTGNVVQSISNSSMDVNENTGLGSFTIPANVNQISLDFEIRYIDITYIYEGISYSIADSYTIREIVNLPTTPQRVRNILNLANHELPDSQIDLFRAYDQLKIALAGLDLDLEIQQGTSKVSDIIDALNHRAALNGIVFLELNVMQSEQSDNTIYSRFANIDFDKIYDKVLLNYMKLLAFLDPQGNSYDPTIFELSNEPADPVTGG